MFFQRMICNVAATYLIEIAFAEMKQRLVISNFKISPLRSKCYYNITTALLQYCFSTTFYSTTTARYDIVLLRYSYSTTAVLLQ